ncbi:methylated-DNA--[protein]-cysteine S-methyltransferase [Streptomyces buecherae]|uniref:Methylated-DNA--[protein]-cysteine S-methyltransferase n=1 Tax=Streptomyces buecherae TaxID=2763006 RepID=A0A7H8N775_9ACTN|nr:methylated-DNA--[protein]-cysteine S-methyltransferase [Streptomyces buecherae]QKW49708.1 methylated-DNA--[protein]-cysteine S-methyltransferase [Streptomyces buecherae]
METLGSEVLDTPVGPLVIVSHEDGAVAVCGFSRTSEELFDSLRIPHEPTSPRREPTAAASALRAYFDGDLTAIDAVEVRQPGTTLMQEAWQRLRDQPAGVTMTYSEMLPKAPRAAGRACAVNRVGILVPCHRVHRTDGNLGGYTWGLDIKRWLRHHENQADSLF